MTTIFGKILTGEIPCHRIYENDTCLAFLDINPINKGHTLLIPKQAYERMTDVPDPLLAGLFVSAKHLMEKMLLLLECDFVRLHVEGVEIPHMHIHLIPSWHDDKAVTRTRSYYEEGEAEDIAGLLRNG